jgi:tRNA-dihydrouridine synthase B
MKNFWEKLKKPFLMLAPMAKYTDSAFRMLCKEFGADVTITELISADAITFGKFKVNKSKKKTIVSGVKNHSTAELLSFYENERPIVIQLFGKNPENFAKASKWVWENLRPDGIDINMGCPARKVVGSDHGAALLKNPLLACEIIRAVKKNCDCPVSVKTRLGWENDDEILAFVPLLLSAGISAVTIHGRTYKDGFKGIARWENIYKVKEIVGDKLIVVGNGDITSASDTLLQTTSYLPAVATALQAGKLQASLDGIAVGRATFGHPWIFEEIKTKKAISYKQSAISKIILKHAELALETKGEHGIIEFRKHLLAYLKGFPEAKSLRAEAVKVETLEEIAKIVSKLGVSGRTILDKNIKM